MLLLLHAAYREQAQQRRPHAPNHHSFTSISVVVTCKIICMHAAYIFHLY